MTKQSFYIVWSPDGRNPQRRHDTRDGAIAEATRLAEFVPGASFIVLRSIGEAKKVAVSWDEHSPDPDDNSIPF